MVFYRLVYAAEQDYKANFNDTSIAFAWCDESKPSGFPVSPSDKNEKCQHKNADHFVDFDVYLQGGSDYVELLPKTSSRLSERISSHS